MRNKEGLMYIIAAGALLAVAIFIMVIASPVKSIKDKMVSGKESAEEISEDTLVSTDVQTDNDKENETNNAKSGITVSGTSLDAKRAQTAVDAMSNIFNISYRNLMADLDSYVSNICNGMTSTVSIFSDPDTKESYSFDTDGGEYTTEDFAKRFADWVVENEAEIEASFEPKEEIPNPPGPFYYIKGTLKINIHACNDITYLADYFKIDNMQLNHEYEIPLEVEVIHDYDSDSDIAGTMLRECEFIELWTVIGSEDEVIEPK